MRTTFLVLLAPSLVLADDLGPWQDAVAYCNQYRPDLEHVQACLERKIAEMKQEQRSLLSKADRLDAERTQLKSDVDARIARLRLRAAEAAEVKRLIPLPLHRQREEIARMDPEIGAIVAQRLGLDGR